MASSALSPELVCGHMLVQVDILEKAVNELDARQVKAAAEQDAKHIKAVAESEAKQSAAMQLVQSLLTQMTELRKELQEVRAHNQALAARLNAELELPRSASGASRPATLEELIQRRDALAKIKAAEMDCGMAKSAGYTCAEARVVGYTLSEAKVAWATDELRAAGYISSKGMTSRDFMDQYGAGRSNFSGLDFTGEDFEGMVLDKACTFSGCIFKGASFRHATLVGVNFSHADLSDCDLSHASLRDCTLTGAQLANSNLTSANLRDCTLTDAALPAKGRWGGTKLSGNIGTVPMKQLGFSCAEVKAMGVVQDLKAAGYTCAEAKQAGYNTKECMLAGFTFQEGKEAGYRSEQYHWNNGKPPPRIEPRLTLAARALPPPSARRGWPRPPPCRRACGLRPACGPPAWQTRAADSRPLVRVASSRGGAGCYTDW
jgi:uncharacterized protein YjbI with pentapeptide repeats